MRINILKKVGNDTYSFDVDKEKELEAMADAGFLASMPTVCGNCKSAFVNLDSNKSSTEKGTFTFVYMRCRKCGAKAQVGQYKAGGFYWKKWEVFNKDGVNQEPLDDINEVEEIDTSNI
jgi:hypothetical protein